MYARMPISGSTYPICGCVVLIYLMHACMNRHMRITLRDGALHNYCKAKDISRDELARRMGVSTATAFRVDDGRTDPSPKFIAALMDVTGQPFEALFEIVKEDAA